MRQIENRIWNGRLPPNYIDNNIKHKWFKYPNQRQRFSDRIKTTI